MLARLDDQEAIDACYLSADGTRLLLQGAPDATHEQILAACQGVLRASKLRPQPQPAAHADAAWSARDGEEWLTHGELWKLSWREAETFADRILAALEDTYGEALRPLRPLWVEACFESVRPHDGSGPAPSRWEQGAPVEVRHAALLDAARKHLDEAQVARLEALLADRERLRALTRPRER